MGHVHHVATLAAPVEFAFAYLSNHRNAPDWMWGLTRLTAQSEQTRGVGAVFDTDIRLGSAPLLIEAVEWVDNQVVSFKATGKRVFRMAPIHHHFENGGWAETTVVVRFWLIAALAAISGFALFYGEWLTTTGF